MPSVNLASLVLGLRSGMVGSFPTDTVPALAVQPEHRQQIYDIKQRSTSKPLILMSATLEELWRYVATDHPDFPYWQTTAQTYLPGAVTLVLPVNNLGRHINPQFSTVGIRIPRDQRALAVLQQTGALLTTSANISDQPALTDMSAITHNFPSVLVWETATQPNLPSTVVAWQGGQWVTLRQGAVTIL
jgi:L-threonylcarbamoyladenylate synthase